MSNAKANTGSGFVRYRSLVLGNSVRTTYGITAGGLYLESALPGPVHPFGNSLVALMMFFGLDASPNNKDFLFRVWFAYRVQNTQQQIEPEYLLMAAGDGQATLSSALSSPANGTFLQTNERLADTLTFTPATDATTPKGPFTAFQTGMSEGTSQVYSPADDTPAALIIPSAGRATGFVIDFDINGGSSAITSANALIEGKPA